MQRIKKRCRYMTREQLDVVLGTTALATSITEYDKKTQKEILLIGDTVKDLDELLGHMERQTDEFELQVTAELEQRGNKVREILGEVQRGAGATNGESRDARGGSDAVVDESADAGGGTGVDGAGGAGLSRGRIVAEPPAGLPALPERRVSPPLLWGASRRAALLFRGWHCGPENVPPP